MISAPDAVPGGGSAGTVLLLAYYYPPLVGIAAERAAALVRHLPALGWRVVVVTPARGFYHRAGQPAGGSAGPSFPPAGVEEIRTASVELSRLLRRSWEWGSRPEAPVASESSNALHPVEAGAVGRALRRSVRQWIYLPDAQRGWVGPAARAAARALGAMEGPRVIVSSSAPYSAHLAARGASRRTQVPWIAEFRDPWSTAHPSLRPPSALRRRLDRRWEARILRDAQGVVHTSRTTQQGVLDAFAPRDPARFRIIRNGFEPLPAGHPPDPHQPFRLLHAGLLAPGVSPEPILEAVEEIHGKHPGALRLLHLGEPAPFREAGGGRWRDVPWLETPGLVTPGEARSAMANASANLLPLPGEAHADRIPGKLLEYLGARRPIVAAIPRGSEMELLAREHGEVHLAPHGNRKEYVRILEGLLEEHRRGALQDPRVSEERVGSLSRLAQARDWAKLLAEVAR